MERKKIRCVSEECQKMGIEAMNETWGTEYTKHLLGPFKSAEDEWELEVVGFTFGNIYQRPALDLKTRAMLTISMLIVQYDVGSEPILRAWMRAAAHLEITEEVVRELAIHACQYVGFPKSRRACIMCKEVFAAYRAKLEKKKEVVWEKEDYDYEYQE